MLKHGSVLQWFLCCFLLQKYLTDREEDVAKLVGGRLSDIANQMDPKLEVKYDVIERVLLEAFTVAMSQTSYRAMPVQVFRQALEMIRRQTSGWSYRSILDMLFYGRKMFSQFLINFEGHDIDELKLIDQFVDFFNVQCLPWIRSHGGWVSNPVINCISLALVCYLYVYILCSVAFNMHHPCAP